MPTETIFSASSPVEIFRLACLQICRTLTSFAWRVCKFAEASPISFCEFANLQNPLQFRVASLQNGRTLSSFAWRVCKMAEPSRSLGDGSANLRDKEFSTFNFQLSTAYVNILIFVHICKLKIAIIK
jgi:hypothetical protein